MYYFDYKVRKDRWNLFYRIFEKIYIIFVFKKASVKKWKKMPFYYPLYLIQRLSVTFFQAFEMRWR